jgi:hypothetical protein
VDEGDEEDEFFVLDKVWTFPSRGGFIFKTIFPVFFVVSSGVCECFLPSPLSLLVCSLPLFDFELCSDDRFPLGLVLESGVSF